MPRPTNQWGTKPAKAIGMKPGNPALNDGISEPLIFSPKPDDHVPLDRLFERLSGTPLHPTAPHQGNYGPDHLRKDILEARVWAPKPPPWKIAPPTMIEDNERLSEDQIRERISWSKMITSGEVKLAPEDQKEKDAYEKAQKKRQEKADKDRQDRLDKDAADADKRIKAQEKKAEEANNKAKELAAKAEDEKKLAATAKAAGETELQNEATKNAREAQRKASEASDRAIAHQERADREREMQPNRVHAATVASEVATALGGAPVITSTNRPPKTRHPDLGDQEAALGSDNHAYRGAVDIDPRIIGRDGEQDMSMVHANAKIASKFLGPEYIAIVEHVMMIDGKKRQFNTAYVNGVRGKANVEQKDAPATGTHIHVHHQSDPEWQRRKKKNDLPIGPTP